MRTIPLLAFALLAATATTAHARTQKAAKPAPVAPPEPEPAPAEAADAPGAAPAPAAKPSTKTIGVDGGLALPTGTWGDGVGVGIGVLARFEMPLRDKLTFTARLGYIQHLGKDAPTGEGGGGSAPSSSVGEVPLFGGVRYAFSKDRKSEIYGAAELGLVYARISSDYNGMSMSNSNTAIGATLGGGYRVGKLDLRGALYLPDLGHAGDAVGLMFTVGYDITAL